MTEEQAQSGAAARHRRGPNGLLAVVLVVVGFFLAANRAADYRATTSEQGALLLSQVHALDRALEQQLQAVDGVLRRLAQDPAQPSLDLLAAALPMVESLVQADASGRVYAASRHEWLGASLAEQPFFLAARAAPDPGRLQLSPPMVGLLQRPTMHLTLPLVTAEGRFDGVISVGLDAEALRALLRSLLSADDAWAGLGHGGGWAFVNEPRASSVPAGTPLDRPGSFFARHRESGQEFSLLAGRAVTTGEHLLMAQHLVRSPGVALDHPFSIAVSRRTDALYGPWWRGTVVHAGLYLALVGGAVLALSLTRRRDRALAEMQRRAAERLELARRGADLGLWEQDLRSGDTRVDEHWNRMLGLPHEPLDPGSARWRSRVHPEDWPRVEAATREHVEGRSERFEQTYRLRHADGRWRWVLDRAQVVERDAHGRPLCLAGTHLDVTETMERNAALQASEERMRQLMEHLRAGVIVYDAEGRCVDANPAACQMTGHPLEALRGTSAVDARWGLLEEDGSVMPVARYPVQQVLTRAQPVQGLVVGVRRARESQPLWVLVDAHARPDAAGRLQQVVVTFVDITARKLAAEELRLLAAAVDGLSDVVIITEAPLRRDPPPTFVFVNPAFERLTGWRRDEVLGRSPLLLHGPETDPEEVRRAGRLLERGLPVHGEIVNYARDGRSYWVEYDVLPLADRSGRLTHFVSVQRDITQRRLDRERLELARADLQATLEAVPDLLFDIGIDGMVHAVHSPRRDLLVAAPEQLVGRRFAETLPAEATATITAALHEALARGTAAGAHYALDLADGRHWFELSVARKRGGDDAQARFITIARDITQRVAAEARLQRLNRSLRVLGRLSAGPAEGEDETAYLASVCRAAVDTGGYLAAWVGVPEDGPRRAVRAVVQYGERFASLRDVYVSWDEARAEGRGPVGRAVRSGLTQVTQDWRVNESVAPWRAAALAQGFESSVVLPVLGAAGRVQAVLVLYAAEPNAFGPEEVQPLEELARIVALGVASLRSRRERDEAAGASQAKTAFLANMSHEIRTPLNAILGLNFLLRRDGVTPQQAVRLDKIDAAGQHLLSIVNDVLDLSKIEAGRMELESANFHLSAVLDNVQSLIGEAARAKGLRVEVDPDAVPHWLRGDPTRLRQALLNFASNAVKFTERGGVALRARLLEEEGDDLLVRFSVEDSGIGIAPEELPRLFQAFEQADASTTRRFGGTGLGLAITQRLAALMGGACGAESRPGAGSTFWFTARLQRGHGVLTAAPPPAGERVDERLRRHHRGASVLLAEDNEVNRELALVLLHGAGLAVDEATNGEEAVALAASRRYALVLMDLQMPVMGGIAATQAIRQLPGCGTLPIIALTANAFDEDRKACMAAGMDDFIAKPMNPPAFYATVLHWLEGGAAGDEAARIDAALDRLSRLPGVDLDQGLALFGGRREPYLQQMRELARAQPLAALQQALAGADRAAAEGAALALQRAADAVCHHAVAAEAAAIARRLAPGGAAPVEPDGVAIELARLHEALTTLAATLREDDGTAA